MPISVPVYQLKFDLDLPEEDLNSALSPEDIQLRKDLARAFVENPETWEKDTNGKPVKPYWFDRYVTLSENRWPFRVAVLIAWLETPKKYRVPKTQDELADLLGMSSDRQFTVWIAKNPQIKAMVHEAWKERALDRINDSMEAMFEVAATPDYKGRGDRELHFKVAEILSDKVILDNSGNVDLNKLSFAEKLRLAGLDNPEALLALRKKLAEQQAVVENFTEEPDVNSDTSNES
ncbi:MAG: hypothetical protein HY863_15700 [Chloroflexi bacterium]|nr:hypothetical protein [Chloroflexota bacterium]